MPFGILFIANLCLLYIWGSLALFLVHLQMDQLSLLFFFLQGGYGTNLAPAKLVGKIFTSLDKSISRMMGTPSAPLPPLPHGSVSDRESHSMPAAAKFVNSQSVMAMSSLMPSASMQSMTEIAENIGGTGRTIAHNRSVSEPDFGRTSKQVLAKRNFKTLVSGYVEFERSFGIYPLVSF